MPPVIRKTTGGSTYAIPFQRIENTLHVKVDVSLLTTSQVDSKGVLKPGVVLPLHGGALGSINGVAQVETHTVAGTIGASGAGNAKVTIVSKYFPAVKTILFAVANNDTASQVAGKARTALAADAEVAAVYTVGGSGADVVLTDKTPSANDTTLVITSNNDTSTGLTNTTTSANTTAGVAPDDAVMVVAATKIADDNTSLASITNDPLVACVVSGVAYRAIVEDNLGRSLTVTELAALRASKITLTLN